MLKRILYILFGLILLYYAFVGCHDVIKIDKSKFPKEVSIYYLEGEKKKMKTKKIKFVKEYQCSGCVCGSDPKTCPSYQDDHGCASQVAGTSILGEGTIFLGLPPLLARLGEYKRMRIYILSDWEEFKRWMMEVGQTPEGHTIVKGLMPRLNYPFIHIFLDKKCWDKIDCSELTDKDMGGGL